LPTDLDSDKVCFHSADYQYAFDLSEWYYGFRHQKSDGAYSFWLAVASTILNDTFLLVLLCQSHMGGPLITDVFLCASSIYWMHLHLGLFGWCRRQRRRREMQGA